MDGEAEAKRAELRELLLEMPLGKLRRLRKSGLNGIPLHKALGLARPADVTAFLAGKLPCAEPESKESADAYVNQVEAPARRNDKSAPREMTSKREVSRHRDVVALPRRRMRDPRFDSLSGKLNDDLYRKSYAFLEDYKESEIQACKTELKRLRGKKREMNVDGGSKAVRAAELQTQLTQLQQDRAERVRAEKMRTSKAKRNREERAKVAKGKKPFYLKKSAERALALEERYHELESSGKLDKFLAKRRKKNMGKDARRMPGRQ